MSDRKAFVLFYLAFTVPGQSFIACDRCQTHEIRNEIKCLSCKATPGLGLIMPGGARMWAFTLCHVIVIVKLPIQAKTAVFDFTFTW